VAVAELVEGEIHVETMWNESESIKKIPGAWWDDKIKKWRVNLSWAACIQLRAIFEQRIAMSPALLEWGIEEKRTRVKPALQLRDLTAPLSPEWGGNPLLYDFQRAGVNFMHWAGNVLLADEMGTGKTVQTLETLRLADTLTQDALPAVVICPKSMTGTWKREAEFWFPGAKPFVITGNAIKRRRLLEAASLNKNALVIINFESVRMHSRMLGFGSTPLAGCKKCRPTGYGKTTEATCELHIRELNTIPFRSVVVDEAHRLKDPNAKQSRAVWAVGQGKHVVRRIALTGTPLANHPGDLWSVLHFIEPKEFPTKSKFVDRYCRKSFNAWGGLEIKGILPENEKEFFRILDPHFRRMPKALVLPQLPKKVPIKRFVQMEAKQQKAYEQMAEGLITRLDDGSVMFAKSDLVAQTRLLQFSSSYMEKGPPKLVKKQLPDGSIEEEWVDTWLMKEPSPKLDAMMEILDEMGEKPVVVCAESRQLIDLAEKRLIKAGITYAKITGGTAQWDREGQLRDFQAGKLRVMLFTIKAGGVGLTMTASDTIVFLQSSWSMVDNKQAEDRVHRIGSEIHDSIKVIYVIAEGTIEETQIERLLVKAARLEEVTRDRVKLLAAGLSTDHLDGLEAAILSSNLGDPDD
jgi:SNF2 family DNA or RNA helicase